MDDVTKTPAGQPIPWECSCCGMPFRRLLYGVEHLRTRPHGGAAVLTMAFPFDRSDGTEHGTNQSGEPTTTVYLHASYENGRLQALELLP